MSQVVILAVHAVCSRITGEVAVEMVIYVRLDINKLIRSYIQVLNRTMNERPCKAKSTLIEVVT